MQRRPLLGGHKSGQEGRVRPGPEWQDGVRRDDEKVSLLRVESRHRDTDVEDIGPAVCGGRKQVGKC